MIMAFFYSSSTSFCVFFLGDSFYWETNVFLNDNINQFTDSMDFKTIILGHIILNDNINQFTRKLQVVQNHNIMSCC